VMSDKKKEYDFKEIRNAKCMVCGEEKECIEITYEKEHIFGITDKDRFVICQTCISKAFRKLDSSI